MSIERGLFRKKEQPVSAVALDPQEVARAIDETLVSQGLKRLPGDEETLSGAYEGNGIHVTYFVEEEGNATFLAREIVAGSARGWKAIPEMKEGLELNVARRFRHMELVTKR